MQNNKIFSIDIDNYSKEELIALFDEMKPDGWDIIVLLYMPPEQTVGGLFLPDSVRDEAQYKECVGLVVKKSAAAYLDPRYAQTGHWCEVGEWRMFPRHGGVKYTYKEMPIFVLKEDAIGPRVEDPRHVRR